MLPVNFKIITVSGKSRSLLVELYDDMPSGQIERPYYARNQSWYPIHTIEIHFGSHTTIRKLDSTMHHNKKSHMIVRNLIKTSYHDGNLIQISYHDRNEAGAVPFWETLPVWVSQFAWGLHLHQEIKIRTYNLLVHIVYFGWKSLNFLLPWSQYCFFLLRLCSFLLWF